MESLFSEGTVPDDLPKSKGYKVVLRVQEAARQSWQRNHRIRSRRVESGGPGGRSK